MNCDPISRVHLVELVYANNPTVGKHHRTAFELKFPRSVIFDNSRSQTGG